MKKERTIIANFIRSKRKQYGYTQKEFSIRSGLGLRFIRELECGKKTLRLDKVNQAVEFFGYELNVTRKGPVKEEDIFK